MGLLYRGRGLQRRHTCADTPGACPPGNRPIAATGAGRLGGDEFAVILPDAETDLEALAARLLAAVHERTGLHASVGIAVAGEADEPAARTVARADASLLEAKAAGKRTYRVAA
jgi:diguanylate cyclase (GGDEF)-like protein